MLVLLVLSTLFFCSKYGQLLLSSEINLKLNLDILISLILVLVIAVTTFTSNRFLKNNRIQLIILLTLISFGITFALKPNYIILYWNYFLACIVCCSAISILTIIKTRNHYLIFLIITPLTLLLLTLLLKINELWAFEILFWGLITSSITILYTVIKTSLQVSSETM